MNEARQGITSSSILEPDEIVTPFATSSASTQYFKISSRFWADASPAVIGVVVTLVHIAVFLTVVLAFHISVDVYSDKGDGISYKHMAAAILGQRQSLTEYDSRVFPGFPLLIASVHLITRLPIGASALAVTYLSAGAAAALAATLFNDRRVGWAVGLLLPHVWINMSLAMSEAPTVALELAGILLARRDRALPAGLVFGLAGLTRPVACFALLGLLVEQFISRRQSRAILTTAVAGFIVILGMLCLRFVTGGSLRGVEEYANSPRAYNGHLFAFPFQSILWMTLHGNVSISRWIYTIAHVMLALIGCGMLARSPEKMRHDSLRIICLVWLWLNTLFILCIGLGPGGWGFSHFPRFMIPAVPPLVWSLRTFLPARSRMYIPIGAALFIGAIIGIHQCT